ncbi:hypothetical protein BTR25_08090 [Bacillus sp. MRMR6]|nr:hypothetical protein BTR25_08090 [Bacillus sp. MRMR6]
MKHDNKRNIFPKFRDDLDKRSKNVVFKNLSRIIEAEYPKLYEDVEYMIDRNISKEALIDKVSLLVSIYTVNEEFEKRLFHTILTHFETFYDENEEPRI